MRHIRRFHAAVGASLIGALLAWVALPATVAEAETLGPDYNVPVQGAPATPTEVVALRTEFSQTFMNPDGSFTAVITPVPRFYRDEHNAWQDVSLSVVPATDRPGFLDNTTNTIQSFFPMDFGSSTAVTVSAANDSVSFTPGLPAGVTSVAEAVYGLAGSSTVTSATYGASTVTQAVYESVYTSSATASSNEVAYSGLYPATDVHYAVLPGEVKESVVLQNETAPASIQWTLALAGLSARQAGNSVSFYDSSGQSVLDMPAPTMVDAAGHVSSQVTATLQGDTLTVTPSPAFLATAQFPVTIDPTMEASAHAGYDTFLSQTYPNNDYAKNAYDEVGNNPTYGATRSLLMFPAPPRLEPGASGASISGATLSMYQDNSGENGDPISAYVVTGAWTASTATWNNQPTHASTAQDTQTQASSDICTCSKYVGTWKFNVTPSVQSWYSASAANYGWMLLDGNEGNGSNYAEFYSLNNGHTGHLPVLSITYNVNPVGSEPFWMQDANGVNPMNGNLALGATDLSTPSQGGGFSVSRTFNSLLPASLPNHPDLFGPGFASNLDMAIADAGGHSPIVFTDGNGLQHVFVPTTFSGSPYEGAAGEYLTLTKGSGPVYYSVQQQDGTTFDFNQQGQLMDVKTHGTGGTFETTTLQRNTSGQLTAITDPSGRTWSVSLNTNGTIAGVTDPAGRQAAYTYTNGRLTEVQVTGHTTSDSTDTSTTTTAQYGYNASGQITSYTDADGQTTDYAYGTTGAISSVSYSYTESSGGTPQTATHSYGYGTVSNPNNSHTAASFSTTITDPNGNVVEYETNLQGNVVDYIEDPGSSPHLNLTTQYTWNTSDELTQVTFPNGQSETLGYDNGGNGLATSFTDAMGDVSLQSYSALAMAVSRSSQDGAVSDVHYNQDTSTDRYDTLGNDTMVNADGSGQVTSASAPVGLGENLVPNSSFELTDSSPTGLLDWDTYSGTTPTHVTTPAPPFGTHSVEVQSASDIQMSSYLPVTPGGGYNLSDWIDASTLSANASGYGAVVNVYWYKDTSGTPSGTPETTDLSNLTGPTPWVQQATEVAAPHDANYAQIRLEVAGAGTVYYDGVSLTPVAGQPNLLLNSSFLNTVPGTTEPDNWTLTGLTTSDVLDTTTTHAGFISEKVAGSSTATKNLSEMLPLPSYQVGGYVLSGWSEESGATAPGGSVLYDLRFEAVYSDGTLVDHSVNFATTSGWQYVSLNVDPGHTDSGGYPLTALRFYIDYSDETGTAWFADPQLQALPAKSTATVFNLVQNPGFEVNASGGSLPDFWQNASGSGAGTASWSSAAAFTGSYSAALTPATPGSGASTTLESSSSIALTGAVTPLTLVGYIHTAGLQSDTAYLQVVVEDSSSKVLGTWTRWCPSDRGIWNGGSGRAVWPGMSRLSSGAGGRAASG